MVMVGPRAGAVAGVVAAGLQLIPVMVQALFAGRASAADRTAEGEPGAAWTWRALDAESTAPLWSDALRFLEMRGAMESVWLTTSAPGMVACGLVAGASLLAALTGVRALALPMALGALAAAMLCGILVALVLSVAMLSALAVLVGPERSVRRPPLPVDRIRDQPRRLYGSPPGER